MKRAPASGRSATAANEREIARLADLAASLARAAGARVLAAARSRAFRVHFKEPRPGAASRSNPVSEADCAVERFIRDALAAADPASAVIGEELGASQAAEGATTWVVDPIDGTANFVNGVPLYACSIGVLRGGCPVAGAIWCASTHASRPGVYHARSGGPLCFDGVPFERWEAGEWRGIAAGPGRAVRLGGRCDVRVLGSAALELAWAAAGLLRLAYLEHPCLWDVAAGLALLRASGCAALCATDEQWTPLERFDGDIGCWNRPVLAGDRAALGDASALGMLLAPFP